MAQYKIIVDTKGSTKKEKQKEQLNKATGSTSSSSSDKDKQVQKLVGKEVVNITNKIRDTGISVAQTMLSTVGIRTDNQARQNEINNLTSTASFAISQYNATAGAIASGAAIGGALGTVTAVVAIASLVLEQAVSMYNNIKDYDRELNNDTLDSIHNGERIGRISTDNNR